MVSVENLCVEFSATPLFADVSFVINGSDRIALVGKNGAGKSTMLKILCGQMKPTSGSVSVSSGESIGYLPQVMVLSDDTTVRDETKKAFRHILQVKEKMERLNMQMQARTDYESDEYMSLVKEFTTTHERYMMLGADNYEAEIERTLCGLGFERADLDRQTKEFSGGWRMRIELAKILLQHPDVLLLDEPTNHLDIESIQWLENFLKQSGSAVVLVSHDRAFINQVCNRTLEISCKKVIDYKVKYDEYVMLRAQRREQQLRAYENQQKEIADIKDFIERFRYKPTKAVQVQSRIKQLEKIVPIEIDEIDTSAMHLNFPPCLRSGDYPVICEDVCKSYGPHVVLDRVNMSIKRGEKVAFVGKNGAGKSTLVKCIMGEIPFEGVLKIAHQVAIGYFAQNEAQCLNEDITVYDTIDRVAKGEIRLRINDILGAFMFGGEASEKKVKFLSGGERSRLAMIRLLMQPVNLLIMDEPTNHLDMASKDVLKEAIRAFDGTAVIVSHDREFLDGLVDKVYEFSGGKVCEYIGGIYDYIHEHNLSQGVQMAGGNAQHPDSKNGDKASKPMPTSGDRHTEELSYAERKELLKKRGKLEKSIKDSESRISEMEKELEKIDTQLQDVENASNMALVEQYTQLKKKMDVELERWEKLSMELDNIII
ncbi:MAG: ABC-F family ATP-binding cassette domain-containing protein [Prevotella sp.]